MRSKTNYVNYVIMCLILVLVSYGTYELHKIREVQPKKVCHEQTTVERIESEPFGWINIPIEYELICENQVAYVTYKYLKEHTLYSLNGGICLVKKTEKVCEIVG